MTLYQKIKTVAEYGHYSLVGKDGNFFVVCPFTDEAGDYRESDYKNSEEECLQGIGRYFGSNETEWNDRERIGWKFIKAFSLPHKYFQPGDKVDVMENARDLLEFDEWVDEAKEMVGQKGLEIKDKTVDGYIVYTEDQSDYAHFPHECLAPHIPEEDNRQVVQLKDGKKYLVQVIEEVE